VAEFFYFCIPLRRKGSRERGEREKRLNNFEKRFAKKKKISTFAVPNKTGVDKRSLLTRKKD